MQLGEGFFDKTLAQSPSAAPAPFSFSFSLVIVNVIHFLYQLEVNEVSMDRPSQLELSQFAQMEGTNAMF